MSYLIFENVFAKRFYGERRSALAVKWQLAHQEKSAAENHVLALFDEESGYRNAKTRLVGGFFK